MTKSELIAKLAARYPQLVAKDAELAVKMILDAMGKSLSQGQRIEIRGFGSFGLNYRPPRTGRNPKSGERVQVPAKHVPHFKAGKELRERVDVKKLRAIRHRSLQRHGLKVMPLFLCEAASWARGERDILSGPCTILCGRSSSSCFC